MNQPNHEEFFKVCKELETVPLNLVHIHRVFGQQFFEIMVLMQPEIKITIFNQLANGVAERVGYK